MHRLAFRISAIFRAIAVCIAAFFLALASVICLAPIVKFGRELWLNSLFCWQIAKEIAFECFNSKIHFDSCKLLKGEQGKFQSEFSWYTNLGLLRSAYERTDDPQLKDQIQFLAANYLAKAAPLYVDQLRYLNPRFDLETQIAAFRGSSYHRQSFADDIGLTAPLNRKLAIGDESPLILTETDELSEIFSLGYTVLGAQDDWGASIKAAIDARNPKDLFEQPLRLLLNVTELFPDWGKEKRDEAKKTLREIRSRLESAIEAATSAYSGKEAQKLAGFIRENTTCIAQLRLGEIAGIKLLPLDPEITGKKLLDRDLQFHTFIFLTGLYINRVNLYRYVLKERAFEKNTQYAVQGPRDIPYFQKIEDLTVNWKPFGIEEKPCVRILGNGAIQLLKGWVQEIGQKRWEEITQNPVLREILDASLYKIKLEMANAELWKNDFSPFTQAMELIYAELATLLELTRPFTEEDFSDIYRAQLDFIPDSLKPHVKAGLGKGSMNIFTGLNAAIAKTTESPVRTYCKGLYFEEAGFMGRSVPIQDALKDPTVSRIDLYATQFNSNIEVNTAHTNYSATDVALELRQLLDGKPDIKHLTVSVDSTIDFLDSPRAEELLKTFEKEILAGKLNFVFFRSGQKFEMLGMDNYYGSPYYMVNNGGEQWKAFDETLKGAAYKTDPLSVQWFCLANRYAADSLEAYRRETFEGTRKILAEIPKDLLPKGDPFHQRVRINTVDPSMQPAFIDIKITGALHRLRGNMLIGKFHHECVKKRVKSDSRASFGFYYPNIVNITLNQIDGSSSLRISPGINPEGHEAILAFIKNELVPRSR